MKTNEFRRHRQARVRRVSDGLGGYSAGDPDAEVERLCALGVSVLADYDEWVMLHDLEGNEFCLMQSSADIVVDTKVNLGSESEGVMKLLLTSGGIRNSSIREALVDLLGKPIAESSALYIPTAILPFPVGPAMAWKTICGQGPNPLCELGWKSLGVLELTALPSIEEDSWAPAVREADALLVEGGHVRYLSYWMRKSGLAELLPSLSGVYVGVSAGSIAATPYNCDAEWNHRFLRSGSEVEQEPDRTLGLVEFSLYPHLNRTDMPPTPLSEMEEWASGIPVPTYAIDDETAIKVTDGNVEIVSDGNWKLLNP